MSPTRSSPGGGFEAAGSIALPALGAVLGDYVHPATGARHLHLEHDAGHEAFMVALRTPAEDSSGVGHVLEHLVLGGSQRYPCRRAFFSMLGRTLAASMNASTTAERTTFHFATHDPQDFDNLLAVYLDAVFFPLLDPLDFDQEGCRIEFERPTDAASPLVHRGVVLNEMRGMAGDPDHRLERAVERALLDGTPHRFDAGGDPGELPSLRYAAVREWHRRHYHPGNALFLSAGTRPAAALQERIERLVLAAFPRREPGPEPVSVAARSGPVRVAERFAAAGTAPAGSVAVAWLVGNGGDADTHARARLLGRCLIGQDGAPLRTLLEASPIGGTPAPASGLDASRGPLLMLCALHGCDAGRAGAFEQQVMETLTTTAREGLAPGVVEGALDRIERELLEQHHPRRPYLLALLERMLPAALHGGDLAAALDPRGTLAALRARLDEAGTLQALIHEMLLDNDQRARVALAPDAALGARLREADAAALEHQRGAMDDGARARLIEHGHRLRARQLTPPDESSLPATDLDQVSPPPAPAPLRAHGPRVAVSAGSTTGLVYARLAVPVPPALVRAGAGDSLGLLCEALPLVGRGSLAPRAARAAAARVCDGVVVEPLVLATRTYLLLEGRALERQQRALLSLLDETHRLARLDEATVAGLAGRSLARRSGELARHGHVYAERAAAAALGPEHAAIERWQGMTSLRSLRAALVDETARSVLLESLTSLQRELGVQDPWVQIVCETGSRAPATACETWSSLGDPPARTAGHTADTARAAGLQAWLIDSPVSYCARVFRAVPADHPDAAPLAVLAAHLAGDPLQGAIRERGGAYGAGARYCERSATVRLFSYRDPRVTGTLLDFDAAIAEGVESPPAGARLTSAVLGVVRVLDRPAAFQRAALARFIDWLGGRNDAGRARFRQAVLEVDGERLSEVGRRYLAPGLGRDAALVSAPHAESLAESGVPVLRIESPPGR